MEVIKVVGAFRARGGNLFLVESWRGSDEDVWDPSWTVRIHRGGPRPGDYPFLEPGPLGGAWSWWAPQWSGQVLMNNGGPWQGEQVLMRWMDNVFNGEQVLMRPGH